MYSYSHSEDIYVEQNEWDLSMGTLNVISSQGALNIISYFFNYRTVIDWLQYIEYIQLDFFFY